MTMTQSTQSLHFMGYCPWKNHLRPLNPPILANLLHQKKMTTILFPTDTPKAIPQSSSSSLAPRTIEMPSRQRNGPLSNSKKDHMVQLPPAGPNWCNVRRNYRS